MKNLKYIIILFFTFPFYVNGQQRAQLIEKHFIKENKIVFRIVPMDKKMFELFKTNSIKITRYNLANNIVSNEKIIEPMLHPYWEADTLNWLRLIRRDKNKTGFIYNAIFQNKADPKLSIQQKDKQEKMVYDLMLLSCDFDPEIAKACGLFLIDSTVKTGQEYKYSFAIYNDPKSLITKELLNVNINSAILSENKNIDNLTCKSKNKISTLRWKAIDYKSDYSGYYIERSDDSVNFKRVSNTPVILMSSQFEKNKEYIFYNDTMPEANKKYFYRIKGINFFGEESRPSNIIVAYSSPDMHSMPLIDSISVIDNRKVKIKWRMSDDSETKLPKKYVLMHSEKDNGKYEQIFESKDKYIFTDPHPFATNFYKIGAITFNNDTVYSFSRIASIIDTISPEIPLNIKAIVDANGNVIIQWKKNNEKDLQGYKLYRANTLTEEFVQINNKFIKDTFYNDKLNLKTLSKKVYYSLAAVDNNFNNSLRCSPVEVFRPDTIAPSAPILISLAPNINGVKLSFIFSNSEDISKHLISREDQKKQVITIMTFSSKDTSSTFIDSTAQLGEVYQYKITAFDENNNKTSSKSLTINYETGFRKKLSGITYEVDRTLKCINLKWSYSELQIEKFIIYRAKINEPLSIVKTIDGKVTYFTDKSPNIGNIYEYRIKAVLYNGSESIISDAVKITY